MDTGFSKTKRGQSRAPILIVSGVIGASIIAMFVFIIFQLTTNTTKLVLDEQEEYTLSSSVVVKGLFSIVSARFADDEEAASCTMSDSYLRPAILTLRFRAYSTPESCSIFVDDHLLTTENRLEPDCRVSCGFEEFNRQFSIGEFDYRDQHTIKVCCDRICLEKALPSLCS